MNYLLLISCSQRKIETPGVLPAVDRYDGPTYRCLRKLRREGYTHPNLDTLIISAKYGVLACQQPIENYDQRMTIQTADRLRLMVQARLKGFILAKSDGYDQVFINLGKTYMRTLDGFHWGTISTMEASGGIGLKTQQMKAWLERLKSEEKS